MALNVIELECDFTDLTESAAGGTVSLVPTGVVADSAGEIVVGTVPVRRTIGVDGTVNIPGIIACDNTELTPTFGLWAYELTVALTGAQPYTVTYLLASANGATQELSAQTPVTPVTAYIAPSELGGGGGVVDSVTAADTSIVIGGTQSNPTVATGTLDVIASDHPPAAAVAMNSKKITGLANGTASTDAAAFGQIMAAAGGTFTGAVVPSVATLVDGATISVNAALGNVFTVTLGGNRTMAAPTNPTAGQTIQFHLAQDATGSRTITWNSAYDFGTTGAPTLTTTASKVDVVAFVYDGGLSKWLCLGSGLGF